MRRDAKNRKVAVICTSIVLVAIAAICSFLDLSWITERQFYSFGEVLDALMGNGTWASQTIICELNAPRVAAGLFIGAGWPSRDVLCRRCSATPSHHRISWVCPQVHPSVLRYRCS